MAEEAPRSAHDASATLKTLRALAAAEQQQCNVARCTLDAASGLLVAASRALRNSLHKAQVTPMLKALLSLDDAALAAQLRLPGALGEASEPSVPPTRLRTFLGAYGSLVTVMRRQPLALTRGRPCCSCCLWFPLLSSSPLRPQSRLDPWLRSLPCCLLLAFTDLRCFQSALASDSCF